MLELCVHMIRTSKDFYGCCSTYCLSAWGFSGILLTSWDALFPLSLAMGHKSKGLYWLVPSQDLSWASDQSSVMGALMHTAWRSGMQSVWPLDAPSLEQPAVHATRWSTSLSYDQTQRSDWHFDWCQMTHSVFSSKLSCSSITSLQLQRFDINPVEQSKWIWTCFIHTKWEQRCCPPLICVTCECSWSQNEVIAGLEVFGSPPWLSPILPTSGTWRGWIIDSKHKLFTQPSSLHQHC